MNDHPAGSFSQFSTGSNTKLPLPSLMWLLLHGAPRSARPPPSWPRYPQRSETPRRSRDAPRQPQLLLDDTVLLDSQAGDSHLDDVARLNVTWRLHPVGDAGRRPGRDDVA